jgi:hypothetical protein
VPFCDKRAARWMIPDDGSRIARSPPPQDEPKQVPPTYPLFSLIRSTDALPMPDALGENACAAIACGHLSFGSSVLATPSACRFCSRCSRSRSAVHRNNHLQLHRYTRTRSGRAKMPNIPVNASPYDFNNYLLQLHYFLLIAIIPISHIKTISIKIHHTSPML